MYSVTKVLKNYPCSHRQPYHSGHCQFLHGYERTFVLEFTANELQIKTNFVIDFGGLEMKAIKKFLDEKFDHTTLLNSNDPEMDYFLQKDNICFKIVILENVGMEYSSKYVLEGVNTILQFSKDCVERGVRCFRVTTRENEKNSATYEK